MKYQLLKLFVGITIFLCFPFDSFTADTTYHISKSDFRYGVFGHYGFNSHISDFQKLPGIPNCCPKFEKGSGNGFKAGVLFEIPLYKMISLDLRVGYSSLNGDLSKKETTTVIVDGRNQQGEFQHDLKSTLADIFLEPIILFNLFDEFRIFAGAHAGFLVTKQYEQAETILDPPGATFVDSFGNNTFSRVRNQSSGDIPETSAFQFFVTAGINYELPLSSNRSLVLAPEISYSKGLTNIVKDREWKIDPIHAGLVIKYRPIDESMSIKDWEYFKEIDTLELVSPEIAVRSFKTGIPTSSYDTTVSGITTICKEFYSRTDTIIIPKKYKLSADIIAVGVDAEGKEIPNPKFKIEEFLYTRLHPLLHYVFFAEDSHLIPDRYTFLDNKQTKNFEVEKLYRLETLPIYWHILNIVGRRMTKYPDANLRIVGCNCNLGVEKGRKDLSMKRAEAVRDYFLNVWKLDPGRLTIEARNLSKKKSTPFTEPDKIVENRRVELFSDVYEILEPVLTTDTLRTCDPPIARFKPSVETEAGLKKWIVEAEIDKNVSKEFRSREYAAADNIPNNLDWNINEDRNNIWKLRDTIDYFLGVEDMRDQELRTEDKYIHIEQITLRKKMLNKIGDKIIDKYNLILFDFDKHYIGGHNEKISDFIKSRVKPKSVIKITGYTDRTGDSLHNEKLSHNRAKSTKKSIGRNDATFKGVGETQLLYDNELPEGRFYCRTVEILVETPIENE